MERDNYREIKINNNNNNIKKKKTSLDNITILIKHV
jgi:hypothetical protein